MSILFPCIEDDVVWPVYNRLPTASQRHRDRKEIRKIRNKVHRWTLKAQKAMSAFIDNQILSCIMLDAQPQPDTIRAGRP